MALSCDMRVAGTGAKVGLPETNLAIIPGYFSLITTILFYLILLL
jgi:enoyl-CoA hydratase/carnithine racemase